MKLLINADDAGMDPARNQGIFESMEHGVLRNMSVIVAQAGWEDIAQRVKGQWGQGQGGKGQMGVGLHFNLTAGKPLVKGHKTLVRGDGSFLDKTEIYRRAILGQIDTREAAKELTAQLKMFKEIGIKSSHLDGHNHVHILPGVREAVAQVMPKGLWVRIPWERNEPAVAPQSENTSALSHDVFRFIRGINYCATEALKLWRGHFRYVDDFSGTKATWDVTLSNFKKAVKQLKGQVCELMCHPGGEPDRFSGPFSKLKERQLEHDVLVSNEFKKFLMRSCVVSVSFGDIL